MDIVSRLRRIEPLASLTETDLLRLAPLVRREHRLRGDRLFYQGQILPRLYIVESGEAVAHAVDDQGVDRPVNYFRAGQFFGENSLFVGEPRDVTVEITADADLLYLDKADLDGLIQVHPEILSRVRLRPDVSGRLRAPHFDWQSPDESTTFYGRRHWFPALRSSVWPVLLLLAVWVAVWQVRPIGALVPLLESSGVYSTALWTIAGVISVLLLARAAWIWVDWRNDYYVLTTRRVVRREKVLLTYESRDEAPLEKIQNVHIQRGPIPRLMGYGDLIIETAGRQGTIRFDELPDPECVRDLIFVQLGRIRAWERAQARRQIRSSLADRLGWEKATEEPVADSVLPAAVAPAESPWRRTLDRFHPLRLRIERDESIIWRKHWFVLLRTAWLPSVLLVVVVGLVVLAVTERVLLGSIRVPLLFAAPLFLVVLAWLAWKVLDWRNDLYMVTPDRIVDMEARPFGLNESRREGSLAMIQNVRFSRPGPLAVLLNFGDVEVETAGTTGNFTFESVSRPADVQRDVFAYMEAFTQGRRRQDAARRESEFAEWISIYHDLQERRAEEARRSRTPRRRHRRRTR